MLKELGCCEKGVRWGVVRKMVCMVEEAEHGELIGYR